MAGSESTIGALLDETGGSIKTGPFGTKLKASEYTATGVPVISVGEVGFGRLRVHHDTPRVDETVSSRMPEFLLKAGDIVFGRKGAVERSAQVQPNEDGYFLGSDGIRIRLNVEECDPKFISYQLQTTAHRSWMIQHAAGTTMPSLNEGIIRRIPILLKPLAEQNAIAAVLGALDDKIELNRRMNATLEAMARALFQSWFVDFDPVRAKLDGRPPAALDPATAALFPDSFQDSAVGHIPSGWRVMKVGEFIERLPVGQKYEQKTVSPVGKVPVLDQGKSGVIGFHNNEPGVTATLDKPVAVFANHTCYMRLITYSFSAIQNVLPFVGSGVDTFWVYYATEGRLSFSEYKGHWPDFVIQESAVPPRELTVAFGRLAKPLVAQMRNNEEESRTLATLRDTLLPKLLSGELSVNH